VKKLSLLASVSAGIFSLSPAPAAEIPLRIAYPSGINGQLAKVIESGKIAEKFGFTPTFHFFQYGPPMIEALAAGEVDVVFTSLNPVASYLSKNPGGLVIIADAGGGKHALVVPGDSPVQSLADLEGKKVAVSFNSDLHVDVVRSVKALGLDPVKDFQLVNLQPQELAGAFEQRLTDAVDIRVPPLLKLTRDKGARIVAEWPWQFVVAVRKGYLDEHPGVVDQLRKVIRDGVWFIASKPDEAAAWWGEQLRLDPSLVKASAELNPLYKASSLEAVRIEPSDALKQKAEAWSRDLVEFGIRKDKVTYVYE
jgi:ABC-type nitrate/sulfonate/bicarbonate transport system substrate-binding protein